MNSKSTLSLKAQVIEAIRNAEDNGHEFSDIDDLAGELIDYAEFDCSYNDLVKTIAEIDSPEPNFNDFGPCVYDKEYNRRGK